MVSRPLAAQLHHVMYDHHRQFVGCFRFFWTLKDDDGVVVQELPAQTIRALVQELNTIHGYFFRLHRPEALIECSGYGNLPFARQVPDANAARG